MVAGGWFRIGRAVMSFFVKFESFVLQIKAACFFHDVDMMMRASLAR
jgi:hypothetical protein